MSILLNSNITTELNNNVKEAMEPFYGEAIDLKNLAKANQKALKAYKEAIDKIYRAVDAKDEDSIILTSSASEATSQIFMSMYLQYILTGRKNSIIISARASIEELKLAQFLESQGCRVYRIPATVDGTIDVELLKEYLNSKTALVSVPLVDEESGVIQPIEEISVACSMHDIPLYCNAKHAIGKIAVSVQRNPVAYMSFEGSTIGGPKDIGALYINEKAPELMSLIYGANSEQAGLRAMPKEIANVIGFATALEVAIDALDFDMEDVRELRDELEQELLLMNDSYSLAPWALRVPNVCIMAFANVHASMLLDRLAQKDIVAYSFATFNNRNFERTSIIDIASLESSLKHCVVGFSLNINNTEEEIKTTVNAVKEAVAQIRSEISGGICEEAK